MLGCRAGMTGLVVTLGILCAGGVHASTIYANSSSRVDVQTAVDLAVTGDTVVVPPGTSTWNDVAYVPPGKKIALQGAGTDSTLITRSPSGPAVELSQSGSRISGFAFTDGWIDVDGDGWRIDHCQFSSDTFMVGVSVRGAREDKHPTGLVDHCVFLNTRLYVTGWAGLLAHKIWAQPLALGTVYAVYVEDCTFTSTVFTNSMDSHYGGRYVFRYNTVNDSYIEAHSIQGNHRGSRSREVYNNTFNQVNMTMLRPMFFRAGTGVVFNNTLTGTWGNPSITLDNVRSCTSVTGGGLADGTSPWDGNEPGQAGYPARDQIGCSTDQWVWTEANPYPPQELDPMYCWNNRYGANDVLFVSVNCAASQGHIQENRDYYNNVPKPGYTPYTYPHPLIAAWEGGYSGGGGSFPQPPTGLRLSD